MKICFVTREYSHPLTGIKGGIGVFVKQYASKLTLLGIKVHVFTFGYKSLDFIDGNVQVFQLKDLSKFNHTTQRIYLKSKLPGYISLKMLLALMNRTYRSLVFNWYAKKHRINIVEFHDYGGDLPFYYGTAKKVIRCHGSARSLHLSMDYVYRKVDDFFEGVAFKNYKTNIVAVSNFAANSTQNAFRLKNIPKVIYNGVKISKFDSKMSYLEEPTIPFSIFYFGSVRERKGIDIACKTFTTILDEYPSASLHVIGHNNNEYWSEVCTKYLTANGIKKTTYYGVISHTEITDYLNKAHLILFPSYGENFSLALLEVMALGKVVVTSNIPAFKEVIVHKINGLMANSEKEYIDCVKDIFDDAVNVDEIARRAQKDIKSRFNLDTIINENIKYYKTLN